MSCASSATRSRRSAGAMRFRGGASNLSLAICRAVSEDDLFSTPTDACIHAHRQRSGYPSIVELAWEMEDVG